MPSHQFLVRAINFRCYPLSMLFNFLFTTNRIRKEVQAAATPSTSFLL